MRNSASSSATTSRRRRPRENALRAEKHRPRLIALRRRRHHRAGHPQAKRQLQSGRVRDRRRSAREAARQSLAARNVREEPAGRTLHPRRRRGRRQLRLVLRAAHLRGSFPVPGRAGRIQPGSAGCSRAGNPPAPCALCWRTARSSAPPTVASARCLPRPTGYRSAVSATAASRRPAAPPAWAPPTAAPPAPE